MWKRILLLVSPVAVLSGMAMFFTLSYFGVAAADDEDEISSTPEKQEQAYPNLSPHLNHLVEGHSSGEESEEQAAERAPVHSGGSVAVTIYLDAHVSDVKDFLGAHGGDVRNVGSDYIEAYVPVGLLGLLSQQPGVTQVWEIIPPEPVYGNVTSQAVGLHLADSWQNAGHRGQGVKVGIIDVGFTGYSSLMGVELPTSVVARCYTDVGVFTSDISDCEAADEEVPASVPSQCRDYVAGNLEGGEPHGTAVAEAVTDIAPDAAIYISQPGSWADLQETVAWMAGQGVQVINYSVGWTHYGSRGDGTSPLSTSPLNTVDLAVESGITWVNAAGNSADDTWYGSFSDHDGDGAMGFNSSGAEINTISLRECRRYTFQLRWEDTWGGADTDLDMVLWDRSTGAILSIPREWGYIGSAIEQSGASDHEPFEYFSLRSPINSVDVGIIVVHAGGPEPGWVQLEMFSGPGGLGIPTGNGSITNPAESANPGLLAVGAAPFYDINSIEPFSSLGPAPDGRIKPDIVGVDCAASVSYEHFTRRDNGQDCWFPGTSQASPHVAGLAALVKQANPFFTPRQVAEFLKSNAIERGTTGPDNTWGHGFAQMPVPPACPNDEYPCKVETQVGDGEVSIAWTRHQDHQEHQVYVRNQATQETDRFDVGAVNAYTVTGLTNGQEYRFWVRSRLSTTSAWTKWSSPVDATPKEGVATPTPTPGPGTPTPTPEPVATCPNDEYPCNVETQVGDGQITLTWTRHQDHQEHQVYIRNQATQETDRFDVGPVGTYTTAGLTNGQEYRFWVRSRLSTTSAWTKWSSPVDATPKEGVATPTPTPGPGTPTPTPEPVATCPNDEYPCNVETQVGDGQITLTWTRHQDHQEHQVYIRNQATQETDRFDVGPVGTYTTAGLTNGQEYRFWVRSRLSTTSAWTKWSSPVDATPKEGVATPTPTPGNACSVGLPLEPGQNCSHASANFIIEVDSNGEASLRFTGTSVQINNLRMTRSGNNWTIDSLP